MRIEIVEEKFDKSVQLKSLIDNEDLIMEFVLYSDKYVASWFSKIKPKKLLKFATNFGFSKKVAGHQELLKVFTEGFKLIKNDGTFYYLAKKHGIELF